MQTSNETAHGNAGDLKHPEREEWMAWLYRELPREQRSRLAAHLKSCAQCRADVQQWRGAMQTLDEWRMPAPRPRIIAPLPLLKWGIAAALTLAIGFGAGRLASASGLRASLKKEIIAELSVQQQQQLADYEKAADEQRNADNKVIFATIARENSDRLADFASLHKDLETMALLTEQALNQTQQQIGSLANSPPNDGKTPNQ